MMNAQLAILGALIVYSSAATWDYGSNGPSTWGDTYDDCNGNSQSPIDIITSSATIDYDLPIVNRSHFYTPPTNMTISNNGHAVVVGFNSGMYTINDAALLPFPAQIVQYHLHWGSQDLSPGAEHKLDGKQYFGELHAVHMNTKYDNISHAIDKSDGLAVFGWFIDVTYPQTNQDMKVLLDLAKNNASNKDDQAISDILFSLETLLPPDLSVYYRYSGSLTTPGCFESVVWTVFEKPIEITREQATFLASNFFSDTDGKNVLVNNFRPVQSLNGRKITKPAPLVQESGAAVAHPKSILALVTGVLLVLLY